MSAAGAPQAPSGADGGLFQKRRKIQPRFAHGRFARLRVLGVIVLLGLYYGVAWLPWEGRQAILWDLPARKFYIFGWVFWPQDFIYLAVMLIIAALSLFLFTALAGRLWCGYACPQTVWTEVFLWIERLVEGDRHRQIQRDRAPLSAGKLGVKATKHALWLIFALFTGFTFVGYFTPIRELTAALFAWQLGGWETFWILFYSLATYGNAGWLREQVCFYMCPYARFQSAMFDGDTLIVSYDGTRGEPRGGRKRGTRGNDGALGDCVSCLLCVQVCPVGIDIRDGLQYECIGCAACIDVCDTVMQRMGYAPGLIRYTTEHRLHGRPGRSLRPRLWIYAAILVAITAALVWSLAARVPLGFGVTPDRNQLFRENATGRIENVYTLQVLNMDSREHSYDITVLGLLDPALEIDGGRPRVAGGATGTFAARVHIDIDAVESRSMPITFRIHAIDDAAIAVEESSRFLGPAP
ncbi:MAG: cytochrome c oxidase accessory protein CcoG [Gammaproteobacteria bacterium]|nr:cytochrome c oxidase accessory protein CcoG [Gammaproteobacteria bacterium]